MYTQNIKATFLTLLFMTSCTQAMHIKNGIQDAMIAAGTSFFLQAMSLAYCTKYPALGPAFAVPVVKAMGITALCAASCGFMSGFCLKEKRTSMCASVPIGLLAGAFGFRELIAPLIVMSGSATTFSILTLLPYSLHSR